MFLALLVGLFLLFGFAQPAQAMTIGIQDQGADPGFLTQIAGELGTRTVRVVATPQNPHTGLIRDYHDRGLTVQASILIKRQTTVGDIRSVMQQWHGLVRTVSVGNEPELNGVPACVYARFFRRAAMMIRREFPGTTIGFGEFSPVMAFEYIQKIGRCHVRVRADFTAVHPYQFFSDPLSRPTEKSGVGTWLGLGNLGAFRDRLRHLHLPARLRATEFSYLTTGPYKISMQKATSLWPRAIKQAARYADQLIIYGLGEVHASSTWGSASLFDRFGVATPAYQALAKALGRVLPVPTGPPAAPAGDLITDLPNGETDRKPLFPSIGLDEGSIGAGAATSEDDPDPDVLDDPAPTAAVIPDVCKDDDVTEDVWQANNCEAYYPDDTTELQPQPDDDPVVDESPDVPTEEPST